MPVANEDHQVSDVLLKYFAGADVTMIDNGCQGRLTTLGGERQYDITSIPSLSVGRKNIGYLVLLDVVAQVQRAFDEISRLVGDVYNKRDDV
jgi:hypothetical protein